MAVRGIGAPRLRRADRGREGFVALACALSLLAGATATWPALEQAHTHFLAGGAPGRGEAAPGDHLQTGYRLWLVGHQLEHGRAPWRDPYTFRPESSPRLNLAGWPFGLPYWPLVSIFGAVVGWNLFLLLTYLGAGGLACGWLRALGLPRAAALAGGIVFAVAPYRVEQSAGHLLGPISLLLPAALWAFERRRPWLAGAALASIPLSGQVHLALGAIPFFVLYAVCRTRERRALLGAATGAVAAIGTGLVVQHAVIAGSLQSSGRSLEEVASYSADWADFLSRSERHGSEPFVFLGWLTPLIALAGLGLLLGRRRLGLGVALALGAVMPVLLALGTNLPLYSVVWHHFEPLRYPRVPERLMPIACLALAALVAVALSRLRPELVALAALVLVVDLHVHAYGASAASPGRGAYAALRTPGRLLELPVFLPDVHFGSAYLYYDMAAQRERPGGYSTLAPPVADETARLLQRLGCGDWTGGEQRLLELLGVHAVLLHRGLYRATVPAEAWFAWRGLVTHGFGPVGQDGAVTAFEAGGSAAASPPARPSARPPIWCQGWSGGTRGRRMTDRHTGVWVYGDGRVELRVEAPAPLRARFAVDGRAASTREISAPTTVLLRLHGRRWHLVTLDVPRLVPTGQGQIGLELRHLRGPPRSRGN